MFKLYSLTFSDVLCCVIIQSCAKIPVYIFRQFSTSQCNINTLCAVWGENPEQAEGFTTEMVLLVGFHTMKISLPHTTAGHMSARGFVRASILGASGLASQKPIFQTHFYNLLQKDWTVVIYYLTECMNAVNKTEVVKLVHAALWNELDGGNNSRHTLITCFSLLVKLLIAVGIRAETLWLNSQEVLFSTWNVFVFTAENIQSPGWGQTCFCFTSKFTKKVESWSTLELLPVSLALVQQWSTLFSTRLHFEVELVIIRCFYNMYSSNKKSQ